MTSPQNEHFPDLILLEITVNPFLSTIIFLHFGQNVLDASDPETLPIYTNLSPAFKAISLAFSSVETGVAGNLVSLCWGWNLLKWRGLFSNPFVFNQLHICVIIFRSSVQPGTTRFVISSQTFISLRTVRVFRTVFSDPPLSFRYICSLKALRSMFAASMFFASSLSGSSLTYPAE